MISDNQDVMKQFFSGKLKEEIKGFDDSNKVSYDEPGYAIGIAGHKYGSYNEFFLKQQSDKQTKQQYAVSEIYLSNIRLDNLIDTLSKKLVHIGEKQPPYEYLIKNLSNEDITKIIKSNTDHFGKTEIPKLLIIFHNLLNEKDIYVEWTRLDNKNNKYEKPVETVELKQFYTIPSAYSKQYDWWDSYGVLFIGPDDLKSGTYYANIVMTDKKRAMVGKIYKTITDSKQANVRFMVQ